MLYVQGLPNETVCSFLNQFHRPLSICFLGDQDNDGGGALGLYPLQEFARSCILQIREKYSEVRSANLQSLFDFSGGSGQVYLVAAILEGMFERCASFFIAVDDQDRRVDLRLLPLQELADFGQ